MVLAVNLGFNQALIVAMGLYITAILFLFYDLALHGSRRRCQNDELKSEPAIHL